MDTELQKIEPTQAPAAAEPEGPGFLTVFARDPAEMVNAQKTMIAWSQHHLERLEGELRDLEKNLEVATRNRWSRGALSGAVSRHKRSVTFFDKVTKALEAGYIMIPDFPAGVFAIRTKKTKPTDKGAREWSHNVPDEPYQALAAGAGEYRDPEPTVKTVPAVNQKGETKFLWKADELQEVGFPFTLVRPEIFEATERAMAMKIFDEMLSLPAQPTAQKDPMVVGRIHLREGYRTRTMTFLVAWFVDLRSLRGA